MSSFSLTYTCTYFQYYLTALYHEAVCGENDGDNDDTQELIDHCHPATHCL